MSAGYSCFEDFIDVPLHKYLIYINIYLNEDANAINNTSGATWKPNLHPIQMVPPPPGGQICHQLENPSYAIFIALIFALFLSDYIIFGCSFQNAKRGYAISYWGSLRTNNWIDISRICSELYSLYLHQRSRMQKFASVFHESVDNKWILKEIEPKSNIQRNCVRPNHQLWISCMNSESPTLNQKQKVSFIVE